MLSLEVFFFFFLCAKSFSMLTIYKQILETWYILKLIYYSTQAKEEMCMKYARVKRHTYHIKHLLVETFCHFVSHFLFKQKRKRICYIHIILQAIHEKKSLRTICISIYLPYRVWNVLLLSELLYNLIMHINILIDELQTVFQGWTMYAQLLISLFKFLAPFLRNVELAAPIQTLYKVSVLTFQ